MSGLSADRAVELGSRFMDRVTERVEAAREFADPAGGRAVRGRPRRRETKPRRFEEEVRLALEAEGVWSDVLFERLPRGRRAVWEVRSGSLLWRRTALLVVAAVAHPLRELVRGTTPAAMEAAAASRQLPAEAGEGAPVVAAVLSTSGWRGVEEAEWPARSSVYLVEPAPGDGFRLAGGPTPRVPGYLASESEEELVARVGRYVSEARVELVLRGLEAGETAERTGVPLDLVRGAFERAAERDEFLRLAEEDGATVLRRA